MNHPDPKKHLYISLVKSMLRIGAGLTLYGGNFVMAGTLLVLAEVLGILEEVV